MTIRPAGMTLDRALEIATAIIETPRPRRERAPVMVPKERAELIRRMHTDGAHDGVIAEVLGTQRRSAAHLRRALGLPPNPDPRTDPVRCRRGHLRTDANQYHAADGSKRCRECRRDQERNRPRKPRNTTNQKADNA